MIASSIIINAYREGNLIPVGTTPTTAEQTEALDRLNVLVRALLGHELGSRLRDWPVPSGQRATSQFHTTIHSPYPASVEGVGQPLPGTPSDTGQWAQPPANSRLLVRLAAATTIYFPEAPQAGARMSAIDVGSAATLTINPNGRLIEGAATIDLEAGFEPQTWFYRDDLADWVLFADMAAGDESVLAPEFDEFLITALIIRLSPTYGLKPGAGTIDAYSRGHRKLTAYYEQKGFSVGTASNHPSSAQSYRGSSGFMD